ncbi:MAG: hypothetical protein ICV73_17125, partial [Acetobacteraceae bacterium]|nr:hypothetical protein [Acetobacteraceae bacterium]
QAAPLGLLAFLTLAVANLACHGEARRATGESASVAAFGLTGAATLPQAGGTFHDVQVACLVIGALLALLVAAATENPAGNAAPGGRRGARLRLLAGALGGVAVGLKLTAAVYAPALAVAAALGAGVHGERRARALALFAAGGAAGFALAYGPWGWVLHERFGNPFGPFLNGVFRSPWFPPHNQADPRFLPDGLAQALVYPLFWARPSVGVVTEEPMADPRFALGLAGLVLAAGAGACRRSRRRGSGERTARRRATRMVLGFVLVAYVAWLGTFAILRYAVPIEVLLGVAVWAAARDLLTCSHADAAPAVARRRGAVFCVGAALFFCGLTTAYPAWPRRPFEWEREPRGAAAVAVTPLALPEGSLVVALWGAVSFVAPFIDGPGVRFVGAAHPVWAGSDDYLYGRGVRRLVRSHRGPGFVLVEDPSDYNRELARSLAVEIDPASCRAVPNNLTPLVQICRWR